MMNSLQQRIVKSPKVSNTQSQLLTHTEPLSAKEIDKLIDLKEALNPYLRDFGFLIFGEYLEWSIKEMWMNISKKGGHQLIHSHANSFISAIIYLSDIHPSARTIFHRGMGGNEFVFTNKHQDSSTTPYNADRWVPDEIKRGDLILFPSYMLHAVPPNEGGQRITIAFNALPNRLKSWDYEVRFTEKS
ncbi:MAG: 2OG-Fe(II) oxygenase family protein [Cellvibrionaceae bacterium]|nr:2OG-Fe(II) oxygenase family protein [Cellvibrionaceae bacterium]